MELSFLIGGEAGMGVMVSGRTLSRAFVRGGYHVFATNEYPSLIRGGHNFYLARVSDRRVRSQVWRVDLLIALDRLTVERHKCRLHEGSATILDSGYADVSVRGLKVIVPMTEMVEEAGIPRVLRNAAALGAAVALVGYDLDLLAAVMRDTLRGRLVEENVKVARAGYEYVVSNYDVESFRVKLKVASRGRETLFLSGNDAVALGAIRAGMKVFAAYPMTPASPILHLLAELQRDFDIVVLQPESELAAINIAIGAWFAGARAMTATSGGGFALMSEALGQAGMMEVPVVIVLAQRQGPSTGLPTYTSQADLRFALHASQGEFPRAVIAPGDVEEAFYLTVEAFNIAERYQMPVIVLTDKYLAESHSSVEPFDLSRARVVRGKLIAGTYEGPEYRRYAITDTGVSPMAIPGTKNALVKLNSSEHDEYGFTCEDPQVVTAMNDKRFKKLELLAEEVDREGVGVKTYGEGDVAVVVWGSTKGPVLEGLAELAEEGVEAKCVQVVFLSPFPARSLRAALEGSEKVVVVESNRTGQLAGLMTEVAGVRPDHVIVKYDGRPFYPEEVRERLARVITRGHA